MKKILLVMFMSILVLAAAQSQGIPATPKTPDEKALSMVLATYAATVNAGDAESWITLWDTDGVQLPPDEPMHVGRPEIWKLNKDSFSVIDMKFNIVQHEITVFGDYGYVRGTYSYTFKLKADGDILSFAGKYLTLCRRQSDGTWRIYRDTFNADAL
jgi:uncharacterized protein (TIGR02246 family)